MLPATRLKGGSQDSAANEFLVQYCSKCHVAEEAEGGFSIAALSTGFRNIDSRRAWLKVREQLRLGTMPPPNEPRADKVAIAETVRWIEEMVAEAERVERSTQGRATMRRLNQREYSNTIRDLLRVNVDLEGVLPDDAVIGGFDTGAESLHFSSYQLAGYLEAANRALDAAFANRPRPWVFDRRIDPKKEVATRRKDVYRHLNDGVAVFASDLASNIQIVFWNFLTRFPGKYRFRISAYAYQTDDPVLFHINGGTDNLGDPPYLIDYFEVPPGEPTVVEFEVDMEARRNIRLLVDTPIRPRELERMGGAADYQGPGLVVQWLEVEGPVIDMWPPPSYRMLLGDLPQKAVAGESDFREVVSQQPLRDAERILRDFASRAFRRPITDDEIQLLLRRVESELDRGVSFERALRVGLKSVLVSPHFLFLREQPRQADAEAAENSQQLNALDDDSLASRLSYFLWSSMPDEQLMHLANSGKLSEPNILRAQVERMLADEKSVEFRKHFVGQWLGLGELDATFPDRQLYPEYDRLLRASMPKEVYLFFEEVLKNDLPITHFVQSEFSILNGRLAEHYGVADVNGLEFRKTTLPKGVHRGGVMTMAAVLKVTANGTTTSPIMRGSWVLDALLGAPTPRPPMGVEAVEPDIRGATTIREQLTRHREVESCASCHTLIDPPGFALENFDVIGGWRENYRSIGEGTPVEVDGRRMRYKHGPKVDASDILADGSRFAGIDQYKQLLLQREDQIARTMTSKLLTYATGIPPTAVDQPGISAVVDTTRKRGLGLRTLIHEFVQSDLFRNK